MTKKPHLKPADSVLRKDLVSALNQAYEGYFVPIVLTLYSFDELVQRESIVLNSSVVALDGDQVVGMGLLGVRGERGWVGGMGVIPSHRRRGISRKVLDALLRSAKKLKLKTVQLEVITDNIPAYELYKDMGFKTTRTLMVVGRDARGNVPDPPMTFMDNVRVKPVPLAEILPSLKNIEPVPVPWQRETLVIERSGAFFKALIAIQEPGDVVLGVCIYAEHGDNIDLIRLASASVDAGQMLATHLVTKYPLSYISYLNVADNDPLLPVLEATGFRVGLKQYEMIYLLER